MSNKEKTMTMRSTPEATLTMINEFDWETEDMDQLIYFAQSVRDGEDISTEVPVGDDRDD